MQGEVARLDLRLTENAVSGIRRVGLNPYHFTNPTHTRPDPKPIEKDAVVMLASKKTIVVKVVQNDSSYYLLTFKRKNGALLRMDVFYMNDENRWNCSPVEKPGSGYRLKELDTHP